MQLTVAHLPLSLASWCLHLVSRVAGGGGVSGVQASGVAHVWSHNVLSPLLPCVQVGEDPLNRREVAELHAELRSPVFVAEVASRARSPQLLKPRDKTDHVTDILTLERPGEVVPQVSRLALVTVLRHAALV